jgi:tripartite-type tricarboxylate transporter receptor subunit TctC
MGRHRKGAKLAVAALALMLPLAACGGDAQEVAGGNSGEAFNAEQYFRGKTIRFVTSSGPGGGTDRQLRVLAEYLPRFIPGNPDSQATNQEPHVAGMNFLWNAKPDGLTIGMTAAPTLEFELFEDAAFDSAQFKYIGGIEATCDSVLLVKGDTGYKTVQDAAGKTEPVLIAQTSSPTPGDIEPHDLGLMLIADYLDLPLEIRRVADSGQDAMNLAMERGEINLGRYGSSWCILPDTNPGWLEDGYLVPILDIAPSGPGVMPEAIEARNARPPHISEVLTPEQYDTWRGMVAAPRQGGNPIILAPETPDEIVEVLRTAFADAQKDPEFNEAMLDAFGEGEIRYINGAEFQTLMEENHQLMIDAAEGIEQQKEQLYAEYVN